MKKLWLVGLPITLMVWAGCKKTTMVDQTPTIQMQLDSITTYIAHAGYTLLYRFNYEDESIKSIVHYNYYSNNDSSTYYYSNGRPDSLVHHNWSTKAVITWRYLGKKIFEDITYNHTATYPNNEYTVENGRIAEKHMLHMHKPDSIIESIFYEYESGNISKTMTCTNGVQDTAVANYPEDVDAIYDTVPNPWHQYYIPNHWITYSSNNLNYNDYKYYYQNGRLIQEFEDHVQGSKRYHYRN
jgi:hypothetical protein